LQDARRAEGVHHALMKMERMNRSGRRGQARLAPGGASPHCTIFNQS
jgi:hypothetical protein